MPKRVEFFGKLPPCLVGMEACATSHQWARELKKLGHDVRLMPPSYVKAYVKRQERCCRCCCDLRGGEAAVDALRPNQKYGAAERADAAQDASARNSSTPYAPTWLSSGWWPRRGARDCRS